MPFGPKPPPKPPVQRCTSGSQKDSEDNEIGTPCGRPLSLIPYRRRDEDVKTLNAMICPSCDSYSQWPREQK